MATFTADAPPTITARAPQVYALYLELEAGGVIELEDGATVFELEDSPGGTAWAAEAPAVFEASMMNDKANMGYTTQRPGEEIPYVISTAAFGDESPTSVAAVVKDITDPAAVSTVTSTIFPVNSPSVSGTNITLSEAKAMTDGKKYRIITSFLYSGAGPYERYFDVYCESE